MNVNPLAQQIYRTLLGRLDLPNPLISYGELVRSLGALPPPNADLKPNDQRLFDALGEILHACQIHKPRLPVLTTIVVRRTPDGNLGVPGHGYFVHAFPEVRDETARLQRWQDEMSRVVACSYPKELGTSVSPQPRKPREVPRWMREPTVIAAIIGLAGTLLAVMIPVWISARRGELPQPHQVDPVVVQKVPHHEQPSAPHEPGPSDQKTIPVPLTLDQILEVLERHRQRVSFGAVAGVLRHDTQSLLKGYVRSPKTSWVVNKATGLPTGNMQEDYPPGLFENARVIETPEDLSAWLQKHH